MTFFTIKGFIFYNRVHHTDRVGSIEFESIESNTVRDIDELKNFVCDFVDNKVVITWDGSQEHLGHYLEELGLASDFLIMEDNGECLINRDKFAMDNARDVLQRLQMGFDDYVSEDWDVKFFRFN
jgi:hypothetical protein